MCFGDVQNPQLLGHLPTPWGMSEMCAAIHVLGRDSDVNDGMTPKKIRDQPVSSSHSQACQLNL